MKQFIIAILLLSTIPTFAQVQKVTLQASGLTCSMCSNAINKSLQTIDFVKNVKANIKNSSFEISLRPGTDADFDLIKKKVEDAGFSVAAMSAVVNLDGKKTGADEHIRIGKNTYHILNAKNQTLKGERTITIVDKGYVNNKTFKKNKLLTDMPCYETGIAASCCAKDSGIKQGDRIYHVTI